MSSTLKYLKRQFDSSLKMLRQSIDVISDDYWHKSIKGWYYSLNIYHILETMEFYLSSNPKDMKWGQKAGYDPSSVKEIAKEILPLITKELILQYVVEIQNSLDMIYETMTDSKITLSDGFEWFGSIFEKHLYLLRHNQHHLGELALFVRQYGTSRIEWT